MLLNSLEVANIGGVGERERHTEVFFRRLRKNQRVYETKSNTFDLWSNCMPAKYVRKNKLN